MPILALKPFEFRRVKYAAGDPLPPGILNSVDLRELQRRGFVPHDANLAMAEAETPAPASLGSTVAEVPAWLLSAATQPEARRGGKADRASQRRR